jgi:histidine ammonia-lyase
MTALNLIPGQLSLAQLRDIYQQPVTLSLFGADRSQCCLRGTDSR